MVDIVLDILEPVLETVLHVPHAGEHEEGKERREYRNGIHAKTHRHTETRRYPKACCRRDAVERVAAKNDEAAGEKTEAHDDRRRDAERIERENADVRRVNMTSNDDEKACAKCHKPEGTRTGRLLGENRTLGTDDAPEKHREKKLGEN